MAEPVEVRIDPGEFSRLYRELREFDKTLASALRRRIRDAATPAVADVKERLLGGSYKANVGLRKALAAATKVSIKTGLRSAGVSITTTAAKLPESKKAMVYAFDKPSFRHPVFADEKGERDVRNHHAGERHAKGEHPGGRDWRWVTQEGRPYFGAVINAHRVAVTEAVEQAITDAAGSITAGELT